MTTNTVKTASEEKEALEKVIEMLKIYKVSKNMQKDLDYAIEVINKRLKLIEMKL